MSKKVKLTPQEKREIRKELENEKKQQMIDDALFNASDSKAKIEETRKVFYAEFRKYTAEKRFRQARIRFRLFVMMNKILEFIETLEDVLRAAEALHHTDKLLNSTANLLKIVGSINIHSTFGTISKYMKKFNKVLNGFDVEIDKMSSRFDSIFGKKSRKDKNLSEEDLLKEALSSNGLDINNLPADENFVISDAGSSSSAAPTGGDAFDPDGILG